MRKNYRCLVLDHDDTVVRSTPDIHYPSFLETLQLLRPQLPLPTLEEYIRDNCCLGFAEICDRLGFTQAEIQLEGQMWRKWIENIVPQAYEGMGELLHAFRQAGGYICVSSHSDRDIILRDYEARFHMEPDMVFGWELPREKRKPHPYALDVMMERLSLRPDEILMVDDMRLGMDMAHARQVDFAWAAWSDTAPVLKSEMETDADYTFASPGELLEFISKE